MSKIVITFPHLYMLAELHQGGKRIDTMFCDYQVKILADLMALKLVDAGRHLYFTSVKANEMLVEIAQPLVNYAKEYNETQP